MRKIKRQIFKNKIGSNKIQDIWRRYQIAMFEKKALKQGEEKGAGQKAWAKLLMFCGGRF